jgi:hypothetical protein
MVQAHTEPSKRHPQLVIIKQHRSVPLFLRMKKGLKRMI